MTARELIKELSKLPPEAEVRVGDIDEYAWCLIRNRVRMVEYDRINGRDVIDLY